MTPPLTRHTLRWKVAQFLELYWWKRYLRNRSTNEYIDWKKKYWRDFLSRLNSIPILNDLDILDAGCGPAGIFMVLEGNRVLAVDPLIDGYAIHIPHFNPKQYPYVMFKNNSLEDLNVAADFDITFCINAINHVSDIEKSFYNIATSTKVGGMIVISTDVHRNNLLKKIFRLLPGDALHPQQHDLNEYKTLLQKNNYNILEEVCLKKNMIFDYWVLVAQRMN